MLKAFKDFILNENLIHPDQITLLAVSGGIDSVVMADLFSKAKYPFAIAHANFQLRGEDSETDEAFVSALAGKYKVSFFCRRFLTTDYADLHGLSTQMAARELRYSWFEEILRTEKYQQVATAHHLDDQIETFFINMLRSTGIAGFHGILPKQGNVIRPILFASRREIVEYVKKNNLMFREDASNQEVKYIRNKIRHELLPVLEMISPCYKNILTENILRVREAESIYKAAVEKARSRLVIAMKGKTLISIEGIKKLDPSKTYLYEFLVPFGFNFSVVKNVWEALDEEPGKQFFSHSHRLIKDRNDLIITPLAETEKLAGDPFIFLVKGPDSKLTKPVRIDFSRISGSAGFTIDPDPRVANLDLHKISFPLTLRRWNHGDFFYPFGRNHRKKVSDFFTDSKFSLDEKENTWILCSGEKIVWIVGYRIDNRFRVTRKTREVLRIKLRK